MISGYDYDYYDYIYIYIYIYIYVYKWVKKKGCLTWGCRGGGGGCVGMA